MFVRLDGLKWSISWCLFGVSYVVDWVNVFGIM